MEAGVKYSRDKDGFPLLYYASFGSSVEKVRAIMVAVSAELTPEEVRNTVHARSRTTGEKFSSVQNTSGALTLFKAVLYSEIQISRLDYQVYHSFLGQIALVLPFFLCRLGFSHIRCDDVFKEVARMYRLTCTVLMYLGSLIKKKTVRGGN